MLFRRDNIGDKIDLELNLFNNVPIPESSSEPEDTIPPATIPVIELSPAG